MSESRHVELPGCLNLRDVGGQRTRSGSTVARGRLYRGAAFSGDRAGKMAEVVQQLGLARVVDLRTEGEVSDSPLPALPDSCARLHVPLFHGIRPHWHFASDQSPPAAAERYLEMLEDGLPSIARIVQELQDVRERPTLIHCAVGRDRTGIVIACLLDLLDVPAELIAEDYAYSDTVIPGAERAHAETMLLFLDRLRTLHGSTRAMLQEQGVPPAAIDGVANALLDR